MASGAAIRQDWPPASADCRCIIFTSPARQRWLDDLNDAVSTARFVQGTSICFIATVGYVTVQEAFGRKPKPLLMAIITHCAGRSGYRPALRRRADAISFTGRYCSVLVAVMGLLALCGLLLAMPETVQICAVPFSAVSVLRDFRTCFANPIFLTGAATLSLSAIR